MADDSDPIEDLALAGNGSKRYVYALLAAGGLVILGISIGIGALRASSTFADDKIKPVEEHVVKVEQKVDETSREFISHKRVQEATDAEIRKSLDNVATALKDLGEKVNEVKERCIEGGGCSPRHRKDR